MNKNKARIEKVKSELPDGVTSMAKLTLPLIPALDEQQEALFWNMLMCAYSAGRADASERAMQSYLNSRKRGN